MKISATSALVLNWTEPGLWQTPEAAAYFGALDLSEGQPILDLFTKEERYMHLHAVSNRKYFMKHQVIRFLESARVGGKGQVIILAAGLAPLSLEIASLFPSSRVFDVDRYLMKDKKAHTPAHLKNIRFVETDITDLGGLHAKLMEHGYDPKVPAIAVMEGIIYYITEAAFAGILKYLSGNSVTLVGDFCLKPDCVTPEYRIYPTEVFKKISDMVELDFLTFYSEGEMIADVSGSGFGTVRIVGMSEIQKQRTAHTRPFEAPDSGWLRTLYAA